MYLKCKFPANNETNSEGWLISFDLLERVLPDNDFLLA